MTRADLADRVLVVTGAARGIGRAVARRAVEAGARVVLADVDIEALEEERRTLNGSFPGILAAPVDVTCSRSLAALAGRTLLGFGRVDALIHCAGILRPGRLGRVPERDLRAEVEVNLLGTILATRAFLPAFERQGHGHFLLVASLGGIAPLPGEAVYAATKFGVRGFGLSLALELRGSGIDVTVVCPDSVATGQLACEAREGGSSLSFSGPVLTPEEVADAILGACLRPRGEILIPAVRGWLTRLVNLSPRIMARLYPALDRVGEQGRRRYLASAGVEERRAL
jgi:short-subunit dehydrogenase